MTTTPHDDPETLGAQHAQPGPEIPLAPDADLPRPAIPTDGGSVLDALRARREALIEAKAPSLELDVAGYAGALVVRYRYPEGGYQPIVSAIERAQNAKDPDATLTGNLDALRACCDAVLGRTPDGTLVDLASNRPVDELEAEGDYTPVRFGKRLAELLAIDVPDEVENVGRYVVRNVFSPRAAATGVYDGDVALMTTGGRVLAWLQDTTKGIGETFSGE